MVSAKILPTNSTIAPTYLQYELTFNLDDYGKKESITPKVKGAVVFCRAPLEQIVRLPSVIIFDFYFAGSQVRMARIILPSPKYGLALFSTQAEMIFRRSPSSLKKRT